MSNLPHTWANRGCVATSLSPQRSGVSPHHQSELAEDARDVVADPGLDDLAVRQAVQLLPSHDHLASWRGELKQRTSMCSGGREAIGDQVMLGDEVLDGHMPVGECRAPPPDRLFQKPGPGGG